MTERSRFWDGIVTGDASIAPYDAPTEFAAVLNSVGGGARLADLGGVLPGELNKLAVSGTVTPVSVATGRALVHGEWYENDAAVSVAIPTPSVSTRVDRIVLRKSWTAQTVRVTRIAGTEGGGVPAMTQSVGVTWDVPLAQVSITTGAAITVTDERMFTGARVIKIKTADETVNNSAVLQDDNDFFWWMGANETWVVEIHAPVSILVASDFKSTFRGPAGASMTLQHNGFATGTAVAGSKGATLGTAVSLPAAADNLLQYHCYATIINGGTAGECRFQWAQNGAVAEDTTIQAGAKMVAEKVSN